ncbi:MAG: hypothetical protein ACO4CT_18910 [Planctomycetota bacterium]
MIELVMPFGEAQAVPVDALSRMGAVIGRPVDRALTWADLRGHDWSRVADLPRLAIVDVGPVRHLWALTEEGAPPRVALCRLTPVAASRVLSGALTFRAAFAASEVEAWVDGHRTWRDGLDALGPAVRVVTYEWVLSVGAPAPAATGSLADRLDVALRDAGRKGMTITDAHNATGKNMTSGELRAALAELVAQSRVTCDDPSRRGARWYTAGGES